MEPHLSTASAVRGRRPRPLGLALALAALVPLMAACQIAVEEPPTSGMELIGLSVTHSSYTRDGQNAICDTDTTEITYELRYRGSIDTVTSRFRGGDDVWGTRTHETTGPDTGIIRDTYEIPPGSVPLEPDPSVRPQIVVAGETLLQVIARGFNGDVDDRTVALPVYIDC